MGNARWDGHGVETGALGCGGMHMGWGKVVAKRGGFGVGRGPKIIFPWLSRGGLGWHATDKSGKKKRKNGRKAGHDNDD